MQSTMRKENSGRSIQHVLTRKNHTYACGLFQDTLCGFCKFARQSIWLPVALLLCLVTAQPSLAWKAISHYISLPVIEGAGLYSSIQTLNEAESTLSHAAAGTNIGLLAANATLGMVTIFSSSNAQEKLFKLHRILGFTITGAAIWLSVANGLDSGLDEGPVRPVTYAYTGLTVVPIILFSF